MVKIVSISFRKNLMTALELVDQDRRERIRLARMALALAGVVL